MLIFAGNCLSISHIKYFIGLQGGFKVMPIKNTIAQHFKQKYFPSKCIAVVLAVCIMGLALSFLFRIHFGADPCSNMNQGLSSCFHMSFGNWQLLFNTVLFCITIYFDHTQIGVGTLANMVLVGYSADFCGYVLDLLIPQTFWQPMSHRILVLIPALLVFIVSASFYMAVDLGTAPYDSMCFVLANHCKKLPFRVVRILWDLTAMMIGIVTGGGFGVVTLLMAFALGPAISQVQEIVKQIWK